jgi:hypothetical protein
MTPGFHSFSNIGKYNNIDVFYTSASKGQDNTTDGSKIKNIKLHFEEDPAGKEWIWVLDCSNMGTSHYTDVAFNIEMTKAILTNKKITTPIVMTNKISLKYFFIKFFIFFSVLFFFLMI